MSPRRVLVLGATGAIGAHAVRACLAEGWRVRALVRPGRPTPDLAGLDVEAVQGDLLRPETLVPALTRCQAFVHAAAFYPTGRSSNERAARAALATVVPVFDAARRAGLERGVYVSSLSTIGPGRPPASRPGHHGGEPAPLVGRETDTGEWDGAGPYFAAKAAMERAALRAAAEGLPLVVVNPSLCLGEYDRKPTSGRLVLEIARRGMPAYVEAPLNVVYTGDVGRGIARALERGRMGERYILGGTNTTFGWLVRQIAFELGVRPPRWQAPPALARVGGRLRDAADRLRGRPAMTATGLDLLAHSQHLDASKAAVELGLSDLTPAVETVRRTVEWFVATGCVLRGGRPAPVGTGASSR